MSLLNDALRKKNAETKNKKTVDFIREHPPSRNVKRIKIFHISALVLLFSSLVLGAWYLLGSLSAQVDTPMPVNAAQADIELPKSMPMLRPKNDLAEVTREVIAPKAPTQTPSPREPSRFQPPKSVTNDKQAVKSSPEKVSPKSTAPSKETKKRRRVKIKSAQQAPKKKAKSLPSREENLFFQKHS